jgi:hypothetical protein
LMLGRGIRAELVLNLVLCWIRWIDHVNIGKSGPRATKLQTENWFEKITASGEKS